MTEAEWMASIDPSAMLGFLKPRASQRKLRLLAEACWRRACNLMTAPHQRKLVEVAERRVDGFPSLEAYEEIRKALPGDRLRDGEGVWSTFHYLSLAALHARRGGSATCAAVYSAKGLAGLVGEKESAPWVAAFQAERTAQCGLIRDIFGFPFRPFRFPADWLGREGCHAAEVAKEIEATGRYEDLPRLADVLERAGCDDPSVLEHCRAPGTHVSACWVIDALLGREPAVREGLTTAADWQTCGDTSTLFHFLRDRGTERKWRLFAVACCRRIDDLITDERSRRALEVAARFADGAATEEEFEVARAAAQEAQEEAELSKRTVEAEEDYCDTTRSAAARRRLRATEAARGAVCRDPRAKDAESGTIKALTWRPSHDRAVQALEQVVHVGMNENEVDDRDEEDIEEAATAVAAAEGTGQCEILRDLFGESFGPPGRHGVWLREEQGQRESWCVLPSRVAFHLKREWLTWNGGAIPTLARSIYDEQRFDGLPVLANVLEEAGCTDPAILNHLRGPGPHLRGCWVLDLLMDRE